LVGGVAGECLHAGFADGFGTAHLLTAFDSLIAHDYLVTEWPIDERVNLVLFSTGVGDGGYPVFVGFDRDGEPTRFVIDFLLVHLDWPGI
jgi:hypothetical protein